MKYAATFLIVTSTASLLACGKTEAPTTPDAPPALAASPQAEPAMAAATEAPPVQAAETPAAVPFEITPPKPVAPGTVSRYTAPEPVEVSAPQPTPVVEPVPAAASPDLAHGQQIYRQACAFCHDKGVAGAPKIGDAAAWSPRLAQGMDVLYVSALSGKGAMPAKGGNPSLVAADVKAAVDYLVAQTR